MITGDRNSLVEVGLLKQINGAGSRFILFFGIRLIGFGLIMVDRIIVDFDMLVINEDLFRSHFQFVRALSEIIGVQFAIGYSAKFCC